MAKKSKTSRIIIVTIILATAYFSFRWMGLKYGWKPTKGQRIATKIVEQERLRQTKTIFEKLITEKPINTNKAAIVDIESFRITSTGMRGQIVVRE